MTPRETLVKQICALPLADRLQIRAALDESVDRDLTGSGSTAEDTTDWSVARMRLEAELLQGLDCGPPFNVDESYWLELQNRIAHRRQKSTS